jgi:transcriptional regulator with XRE-family HTH domain
MKRHPPLHEQIREAREAQKLSQKNLGELARLGGQPNVARLERGAHPPSADTLQRIADVLRCEFRIGWHE